MYTLEPDLIGDTGRGMDGEGQPVMCHHPPNPSLHPPSLAYHDGAKGGGTNRLTDLHIRSLEAVRLAAQPDAAAYVRQRLNLPSPWGISKAGVTMALEGFRETVVGEEGVGTLLENLKTGPEWRCSGVGSKLTTCIFVHVTQMYDPFCRFRADNV